MMDELRAVLRCRKCRKCVLDSTRRLIQINAGDGVPAKCSIWHISIEALPDWMLGEIKEAQWTIGKLNCWFCGARLGGFNFVSSAKCPCGQDVTVHLCKSRIDYESKPSIPISRPARITAPCPRQQSRESQQVQHVVEAKEASLSNTMLPHAFQTSNEFGRISEALCLEARSQRGDVKAANAKAFSSVSRPSNTRFAVKASHRKAHSWDYNNRYGVDISTSFADLLKTIGGDLAQPGSLQRVLMPSDNCADLQLVARTASETVSPRLCSFDVNWQPGRPSQFALVDMQARRDNLREASLLPGNQSSGRASSLRRRLPSESSTEEGDVEEEPAMSAESLALAGPSTSSPVEQRLCKRERNRLKSLRRKQRRRERWIQSQLQDHKQSSTGNLTSSDDEDLLNGDRDGFICAVCLDVYFSPYMCYPCHHIFCEPCLRTLAKNNPSNTPCPLCRTIITHVFLQKELNHTTKTFFPKEYLTRKQIFQKASCAKWPLPRCRKLFHFFGGLRRQTNPVGRRQFPHGGYRLDTMDFEDDSRGWRFDMDMVIIYIYSVNWVIGFIIFCFLCYFFFPSF
ncbi:RN180 ligase, partial [Amia calva]|nr:RN180 ligase [Amia calva]